jgi:hypothetical protein
MICSSSTEILTSQQLDVIDGAFGRLTLANISRPPAILHGLVPDAAGTAEPTLLADKGYDSLRSQQFKARQELVGASGQNRWPNFRLTGRHRREPQLIDQRVRHGTVLLRDDWHAFR